MSVAHDKIQELAYRLWQEDGAPEGRAMDYWLQAEAALHAMTAKPAAEPEVAPLSEPAAAIAVAVKTKAAPKAKSDKPAAAKAKSPAKPKTASKAKTVKV